MISLYTDCLALYFVKERDAMTQPKTNLAYLRSEKAKAEQKLRSCQHREKILERRMSELNRRERVHRLCTRAGMLESFLVCPGELTDDQVIHFTGYDVKNILTYHGIPLDQHVFYSGTLPEYKMLFRKIIRELQQCKYGYEDYIASMFNTILLLVSRQQQEGENVEINIPEEIEAAVAYFNENYNTKISVEDYAELLHISTNWFIRNFKQYMKISPAQYILSLRMVNAQSLLENTDYKIGEIAEIVGYDNQLYFSRVFRKEYGVSSAQYRKKMEKSSLSK